MSFVRHYQRRTAIPDASLVGLLLGVIIFCPGPGAAETSTGNPDRESLDEVVVTARKIEEGLLDVPQSVQVLSGDFIAASDLTSLYDLQYHVPGLVVANVGVFGAGMALRGITNISGSSIAVAPHVNGVYLGRSELALARMFDVERIEVLKGPQGTLYGRNATGGSINVITRPPANVFDAAFESAVGSFDTVRMNGYLNVPADKLELRIAVAGAGGDGYIRNSVDDRRFAEEDYFGIRTSLRIRPADRLRVDVSATHVEDDGATGELWSPRPEFLPDPDDIRLTTVTLENPYLVTENDFASVDVEWQMHRATLRATTGYARSSTSGVDDCAGVPRLQNCVRGVDPRDFEQWSQELRLVSASGSATDWVAGVYVFAGKGNTHFFLNAPLIAPGALNDYAATAHEDSYAAFGQTTYRLNERWSITGGLRLARESHSVYEVGTGSDDNQAPAAAKGSWDDATWRLGAEYSLGERSLLYASVSTGSKSGGVTTELLPNGEFDTFDPESVLAWEMGANLQSPDARWMLLASAFHYDIDDLQVQQTVILENRVSTIIENAASARVGGIDMALTFTPNERLSLSAALLWMPLREFGEYNSNDTSEDFSGNTLSRAPEWTATASITGTRSVGRHGELSATVDCSYRSEFYFTSDNDPGALQDSVTLLNAYLRFDPAGRRWYLFAAGRNLLDTDYFNQIFLQSSPGYPATWEVGFGLML